MPLPKPLAVTCTIKLTRTDGKSNDNADIIEAMREEFEDNALWLDDTKYDVSVENVDYKAGRS